MMFYALGASLCLAVLFLVVAAALPLCFTLSHLLGPWLHSRTPRTAANLLFGIRLLPFSLASLAAFGLALPAFLKFEPRTTSEGVSFRILALAFLGAGLIGVIVVRASRAFWATARIQRRWRARSQELRIECFPVPIYCVDEAFPVLAVTGVLRPKIFVGQPIAELLSPDEMRAALAHELAHVNSWDNLKRGLLRITCLPHWLNKAPADDSAWANISEVAADEEALAGGASALELSSALVKVGQAVCGAFAAEVVVSHFLAGAAASSLPARIAHLQQWLDNQPPVMSTKPRFRRHLAALFFLIAGLVYAVSVSALLPSIHEVLELLVR